jgi:Flp pilus assembly protein CpaB
MRTNRAALAALATVLLVGAAPASDETDVADEKKETVRVLVASRDLAAGETLRAEDMTEAEVPARWATSAVVKPDSVDYVVSQRLNSPVLRGDMIRWSAILIGGAAEFEACHKVVGEPGSAAQSVARSRRRILERR